jgi:hypothetical protein
VNVTSGIDEQPMTSASAPRASAAIDWSIIPTPLQYIRSAGRARGDLARARGR